MGNFADGFDGRSWSSPARAAGSAAALAHAFAAAGASVVAADVEAAALVGDRGQGSRPHHDRRRPTSSQFDAVAALADHAFEKYGAVDVLCNNAGVFAGGLIWERPASDFEWTLGVNLWGILHGIRAFVPRHARIAERPAHIVNTVSMAGLCSTPFTAPYNVSKFAALAATECLAHDLAAVGAPIGVSVVVPSAVATRIGASGRNRPAPLAGVESEDAAFVEQALVDLTGRGLDPNDVAAMILDAIRTDTYLVPTKPSYRLQIEERFEALLEKRRPPVPDFD